MPFKSKSQRRACYARNDPSWDCGEWEAATKGKKLPEKLSKKEHTFEGWLKLRESNLIQKK